MSETDEPPRWPAVELATPDERTRGHSMGYVSVIAPGLAWTLFSLWETLESMPAQAPNPVKTTAPESGYAATIIVTAVVLLESALARLYYLSGAPMTRKRFDAAQYFKKLCRDAKPELTQDIKEIFAIRNAIVHGHLWEAEIVDITDETGAALGGL